MTISRRELIRGTGSALIVTVLPEGWVSSAQQVQTEAVPSKTKEWLQIAESLKPALQETAQVPIHLVTPVADSSFYLRWRMDVSAPATALEQRLYRPGESFILDFGGHRTGYLSFDLIGVGENVDAPARLRFTFGEVPGDVAEPFHPYKGSLGEGWLPEDTFTIDFLPQSVRLPRRYAFRYVKVEIIGTSPKYAAQFRNVRAHAVTSATGTPAPLRPGFSETLQRVDEVSLTTLRDCMQTTFEDGPRRDQRLWIGDMRLQALANYKTFGNLNLVKRCLYLFAAFPREDGLLRACVFEKPVPAASGDFILDYAALYVAALYDYVKASNDKTTGQELWPVAKRQLQLIGANIDANGLFIVPKNIWSFIDWDLTLDRAAPMHGVVLYCYRQAAKLADLLGKSDDEARYTKIAESMTAAAQANFFDQSQQLYVSGPDRQVSLATQAWLVLAGVGSKAMQATALRNALARPGVVMPATPYLYHHVAAAMVSCGLEKEALALIEKYWGGMVAKGADTFWEVYNPTDSLASPYGDVHLNSFCHAWSCTPALLLRSL